MRAAPSSIAIDGPAASGKSSVSRALAARCGYRFLDTGLMYRAFTLAAIRANVPPTEEACASFAEEIDLRIGDETEAHVYLGAEDVTHKLHNRELESHVSSYARLAPVRAALIKRQRAYAHRWRSVLAGRDIGEVVLPDAPLKIYLDADENARARRRNKERGVGHQEAQESQRALSRRDRLDAPQTYISPDAVVIDTSALTLEEVIDRVLELASCGA